MENLLADLEARFLNLRTVEGGIYMAIGAALLLAGTVPGMAGMLGAALVVFGGYKFITKNALKM